MFTFGLYSVSIVVKSTTFTIYNTQPTVPAFCHNIVKRLFFDRQLSFKMLSIVWLLSKYCHWLTSFKIFFSQLSYFRLGSCFLSRVVNHLSFDHISFLNFWNICYHSKMFDSCRQFRPMLPCCFSNRTIQNKPFQVLL